MKLSILTPTIPGREKQLAKLQNEIQSQIKDLPVEHLCLCDNKKRSIGGKRQALIDISRGEYIAFVDDDDYISKDYIESLLVAAEKNPDVVTFRQEAEYNGKKTTVIFKLGQGDHGFNPDGETLRDAWHVCAWNKELVKDCSFLECNYGEDLSWCIQARSNAISTIHIPKVLHYYYHDASLTAAPEPERL